MTKTVLIVGADSNASATALRLYRSGMKCILCALPQKIDPYYHQNFSAVLKSGQKEIDGIMAWSVAHFMENSPGQPAETETIINHILYDRKIPVIDFADLSSQLLSGVDGIVVFDDETGKRVLPKTDGSNKPVVCLHTFEKAGACDYVVAGAGEFCGRVLYPFLDFPEALLRDKDDICRVLQAPREGLLLTHKSSGDRVKQNELIAEINEVEIAASDDGVVDGVLPSGVLIEQGRHVAVLRKQGYFCEHLSQKHFAIAGGVLEALHFHFDKEKQ